MFLSINAINGFFKAAFNRYPKMNHRTSDENLKCSVIQHHWLRLDIRKYITFLESNLCNLKQLPFELSLMIFSALGNLSVSVPVSIGNCTYCFGGEITCGSVD